MSLDERADVGELEDHLAGPADVAFRGDHPAFEVQSIVDSLDVDVACDPDDDLHPADGGVPAPTWRSG